MMSFTGAEAGALRVFFIALPGLLLLTAPGFGPIGAAGKSSVEVKIHGSGGGAGGGHSPREVAPDIGPIVKVPDQVLNMDAIYGRSFGSDGDGSPQPGEAAHYVPGENLEQRAQHAGSRKKQLSPLKTSHEWLEQVDVNKVLGQLPEGIRKGVSALRQRDTSPRVLDDIQCKAGGAVSRAGLANVEKYAERARKGSCENGRGMWFEESTAPVRTFKYLAMAKVLDLDPRDRVLDWGSGCGSELEAAAAHSKFKAVGVDVVQENVDFATKHTETKSTYCLANAGSGLPFSDNSFDAVISNAALYHVDGLENEKKAMKEVVRVLSPGGCAWMGWLGSDHDTVKMEDWSHVTLDNADVAAVKEKAIWPKTEYGDDSYAVIACKKQ